MARLAMRLALCLVAVAALCCLVVAVRGDSANTLEAAIARTEAENELARTTHLDRIVAAMSRGPLRDQTPSAADQKDDDKKKPPTEKDEKGGSKPPADDKKDDKKPKLIRVRHKHGAPRHRGDRHKHEGDGGKKGDGKVTIGHPGENPMAGDPDNHCSACCYGCKMKHFGCEKKCRICCPEGQAAVCDDSPSCTCVSPEHMKTKPIRLAPKDSHDQHSQVNISSTPLLQHLREALMAAAKKIREKAHMTDPQAADDAKQHEQLVSLVNLHENTNVSTAGLSQAGRATR